MKRSLHELRMRVRVVADDPRLAPVFREAEEATRGRSPSSSFKLAAMVAGLRGLSPMETLAVAKAVRWQRVIDRDYGGAR